MWTKICIAVVPGYELLAKPEQREVKARLRERVRWRLAATAPPHLAMESKARDGLYSPKQWHS